MSSTSASINIRITKQTHQQLADLAREYGLTLQAMLDRAVEAYRRQSFLEGLNTDFAALRANPDEWAEEVAERELWNAALKDGLD